MLISSLKPTWNRYVSIFLKKKNISIYRSLEYEELSRIQYAGRILDFGGGEKAHYLSNFKKWIKAGSYESVNISSEMQPTYLIKTGEKIPVDSDTFDMVVSVNTLEHVYELMDVLSEIMRVLKPGGKIVIAVPFLYRVHGCPDDYNRPTASWWAKTLSQYRIDNIIIAPLVWDIMTTGLSVTEGSGPFKNLRGILIPFYGLLYAMVRGGTGERYAKEIGEKISSMALGYVITGIKS